jgi:hypothetical protein
MNIFQAMRLATYIIAQAKKYVSHCGGNTQAVSIGADGKILEVSDILINQYDLMNRAIVEDIAKVVFYATDPVATEMDGEKIKQALELGIAQWSKQFLPKLFAAVGLPLKLLLQQQQAATAPGATGAPTDAQSSNPTSSSTDQT